MNNETNGKLSAEKINAELNELKRIHKIFGHLAGKADIIIIELDPDLKVKLWNSSAENIDVSPR